MEEIWDFIIDYIRSRPTDPEFWSGVATTVFVTLIIVPFVVWLLKQWEKIIKFFEPSKIPVTRPGPSHADNLVTCFTSGLTLFLVALIAITTVAILIFLALR